MKKDPYGAFPSLPADITRDELIELGHIVLQSVGRPLADEEMESFQNNQPTEEEDDD